MSKYCQGIEIHYIQGIEIQGYKNGCSALTQIFKIWLFSIVGIDMIWYAMV